MPAEIASPNAKNDRMKQCLVIAPGPFPKSLPTTFVAVDTLNLESLPRMRSVVQTIARSQARTGQTLYTRSIVPIPLDIEFCLKTGDQAAIKAGKRQTMSHLDHLASLIDLRSIVVVDIGAGDGKFARAFAKRGAGVIGIEIDEVKVEIAQQAEHPNVEIRLGRGEDLPIDDASADLACFMFSFHHIPLDIQEQALLEAHRILKPGGRMHLVEPRPYGSMSEAMIDLADETNVLKESQRRLDHLAGQGRFTRISEQDYSIALRAPDFETFLSRTIAVDPRRAEKLPSVRAKMEAAFERVALKTEDGFTLDQPCVAHHFVKAG